ncbi:hypothetical protein ACFFX0_21505 [Citricoccus parietis]|uniref:Uncharacterized protein n=1 Tax=Citricoccus parietis TaxID=592307 RepID=A0ABV5G3X1_9MICC
MMPKLRAASVMPVRGSSLIVPPGSSSADRGPRHCGSHFVPTSVDRAEGSSPLQGETVDEWRELPILVDVLQQRTDSVSEGFHGPRTRTDRLRG